MCVCVCVCVCVCMRERDSTKEGEVYKWIAGYIISSRLGDMRPDKNMPKT